MSLLIIRFHNKNNAFSLQNFDDYMGIKHVLISISAFEEFDELCFEFGVEPEEPVCILTTFCLLLILIDLRF